METRCKINNLRMITTVPLPTYVLVLLTFLIAKKYQLL